MNEIQRIIFKWYELLELPEEWLPEVRKAAEDFDPSPFEREKFPYAALHAQDNKMLCLLYSLYKCEDFFVTARKRNIPEDILLASLSEIKRYAVEYNTRTGKGKIGILQINWIGKILNGNIYRLGRLEFEIRGALHGAEKFGLSEGDPIIAVHIPDNGGPFNEETCAEAYRLCEEFFPRYFPEYSYEYYTCNSWLMDRTLKQFLRPTSNIAKFMDTFEVTEKKESLDALTYLFGRGTTVEDLKNITPVTGLQKSVREHILNGGKLYSAFGVRKK